MQVVERYPNGIFCWIDLATTDPEAAKAFYSGLFGWEGVDVPIPGGGVYTMLKIEGLNVAGLGTLDPGMQAQGVPPFWSSYIKHDDADAAMAKVAAAGGTVIMPVMDVMDEGRMAMFQDPAGAIAGVWQPKNHIGAQLVNMPNTLVWNELQARNTDAARSFYSQAFGWTSATDENNYTVFNLDGRMHAGMMAIDDSWGDVPSNWAVYIMVSDLTESLGKVRALGGNILVPATPAGAMGAFAVIQDPQGAVLTIMQFNGPVDSPPGY